METIADTYVDFEPYCAWLREEQSHSIAIHLHGFKKEQLRVQINNQRIITVHGQRLVEEDSKSWTRFSKQFRVPEDCNDYGIRARFSAGVLTITMPKKLSSPPSPSASPIVTSDGHHQRRRFDDSTDQQEKSSGEPKSSSCSQNNKILSLATSVAAAVLVLAVSGAIYVFKHSSSSIPAN